MLRNLLCVQSVIHLLVVTVSVLSYSIPTPQFEELEPRGFRVSIEDFPGIQLFAFHGKRDEKFHGNEPGDIVGTARKISNDRWKYVNRQTKLEEGDVLHYWIYVQHGVLGYRLENQKYIATGVPNGIVENPSDESTTVAADPAKNDFIPNNCRISITKLRGNDTCSGALIFEEHFENDIDLKWKHEILIPLETEDAEFLSYQNEESVCYVASRNLGIRPKLLTEFPGFARLNGGATLDLSDQCTGTIEPEQQCRRIGKHQLILPPVVSCKLSTKDSFTFKYGKVQIRAKMPKGDWLFPQLYLEPAIKTYGDQGFASGLMRVAFIRANEMLRTTNLSENIGGNVLYGGVVISGSSNNVEHIRDLFSKKSNSTSQHWGAAFHVYELVWTDNNITVAVDGQIYGVIDGNFKNDERLTNIEARQRWAEGGWMAPFDKEFYVSLGVGVGGMNDFPDGLITDNNRYPKPWTNYDPKAELLFWEQKLQWHNTWEQSTYGMEIDYVKVWAI